MATDQELLDVIKNGPLRDGECLLSIKGQSFRVFIRNIQFEMDYGAGIPEFTLQCVTFDNAEGLCNALINSGES